MSEFAVRVVRIDRPVEDHPDADRLSLVHVGGYVCIAAKREDGSHRLREGDFVAYIPEGAVLPEPLLRAMGLWREAVPAADGKPAQPARGALDGSRGDRVKARRLRGIFSQGLVLPVERTESGDLVLEAPAAHPPVVRALVREGEDVKDLLGVSKWEPEIPVHMAGEVCSLGDAVARFDFESIQAVPWLFAPGEEVAATEKGHGTFVQIGYLPGLAHPECFAGGRVYVASKGLGNKGLAFKDNPANAGNLYVRVLRAEIDRGLVERMAALSERSGGAEIRVFGEIMGRGVQDLHYGFAEPALRVFDVDVRGQPLTPDLTQARAADLGLLTMPTLYRGPYSLEALAPHRDGRDTFGGGHVREGIVIRAADGGRHPRHGRKIAKWVSPAYLLRSAKNATEYQ